MRHGFVLVVFAAVVLTAACGGSAVPASSAAPSTTAGTVTTTAAPSTRPSATTLPPTTIVPTTKPATIGEAAVIAVIAHEGGCMMMGPNCPTYVVWSDGRVAGFRDRPPVDPFTESLAEANAEVLGVIDAAVVQDLADAIAATDVSAMQASLGPGVCNGCVDGIDYRVELQTLSGRQTLSSVAVDFDRSLPLFGALLEVIDATARALPLATVSR